MREEDLLFPPFHDYFLPVVSPLYIHKYFHFIRLEKLMQVCQFGFSVFFSLVFFKYDSSSIVHPYHLYLLSPPRVISRIISFWTKIFIFLFCALFFFPYQKPLSVIPLILDSYSIGAPVSFSLFKCYFLMASPGRNFSVHGFRRRLLSPFSSYFLTSLSHSSSSSSGVKCFVFLLEFW